MQMKRKINKYQKVKKKKFQMIMLWRNLIKGLEVSYINVHTLNKGEIDNRKEPSEIHNLLIKNKKFSI